MFSQWALALSLILLRRLRQPVRRLQLERERGKVEPAALNEQPGVPTALFRAEEQERALGIIGRGGGNQARNGMTKSDAVQLQLSNGELEHR